jgi:hypothetical protein
VKKLSKSEAGYVYRPETEYLCGQCTFAKPIGTAKPSATREYEAGCALFGPDQTISPQHGSCNNFLHGEPAKFDIPWLALATPVEFGYLENGPGFTCSRCEHYSIDKGDCEKVDKDSEGDTPGEINLRGCCNLWEKDAQRGSLSRPVLMKFIEDAHASSPARAASLEDYEKRRKK